MQMKIKTVSSNSFNTFLGDVDHFTRNGNCFEFSSYSLLILLVHGAFVWNILKALDWLI